MLYLYTFLLALFLGTMPLHAKPVSELTKFTETEIATLTDAINEAQRDETPQRDWAFRRFLLRIAAKVGFDIEVIKLEVIPELELVWQKQASEKF